MNSPDFIHLQYRKVNAGNDLLLSQTTFIWNSKAFQINAAQINSNQYFNLVCRVVYMDHLQSSVRLKRRSIISATTQALEYAIYTYSTTGRIQISTIKNLKVKMQRDVEFCFNGKL
jgi:hypothetical protein